MCREHGWMGPIRCAFDLILIRSQTKKYKKRFLTVLIGWPAYPLSAAERDVLWVAEQRQDGSSGQNPADSDKCQRWGPTPLQWVVWMHRCMPNGRRQAPPSVKSHIRPYSSLYQLYATCTHPWNKSHCLSSLIQMDVDWGDTVQIHLFAMNPTRVPLPSVSLLLTCLLSSITELKGADQRVPSRQCPAPALTTRPSCSLAGVAVFLRTTLPYRTSARIK